MSNLTLRGTIHDPLYVGEDFSPGVISWLKNLTTAAGKKWERISTLQISTNSSEEEISREISRSGRTNFVALGDVALKALTRREGISNWRGSPLPLTGKSEHSQVIPTLAPEKLMRQPKLSSAVIGDLKKSYLLPPENYNLFPTIEEVEAFHAKRFAFDLEWDADGCVTLCGLSDRFYSSLVVPWIEPYLSILRSIFEGATDLIGHNIVSADLPHIEALGWDLSRARIHDTILKQHLVQPDYPRSLAFVASIFTNKVFWKGRWEEEESEEKDSVNGQQWRTWDRPWAIPRQLGGYGGCGSGEEAFHLYNARDTDAEFQVNTPLSHLLTRYKLEDVYRFVSLPIAYICREMSARGIKLDSSQLGSLREGIDGKISELEALLPEGLRPYEKEVTCNIPAPPGIYRPKRKACSGTKKAPHEKYEHTFNHPDQRVDCPFCSKSLQPGKMVEAKVVKGTRQEKVVPYNSPPQLSAYVEACELEKVLDPKTGRVTTGKRARSVWARNHPEFAILGSLKAQVTLRNNFAKDALLTEERMYFNLKPYGTSEGRLSSSGVRRGIDLNIQNCFSPETEILTKEGWTAFKDLRDKCEVAQVNQRSRNITFTQPTQIIRQPYQGNLNYISTDENIDLCVTPEHECLYYNAKTEEPYKRSASNYPSGAKQAHAGWYVGGIVAYTEAQVTLLAALQADGHVLKGGQIEWIFTKERKIARLKWALDCIGAKYRESPKGQQIRIYCPKQARLVFLKDKKLFGPWILDLNFTTFRNLAEEVWFWDGCYDRRSHYSSSIKENADWVQILTCLSNRRANIREYWNSNPNSVTNYQVDATRKWYSITTNVVNTQVPYEGIVYCVTVPEGNIIVRRNGKVCITGNCPKEFRTVFSPDFPGWCWLNLDIVQGENMLTTWLAKDWERWERINSPGYDEHCDLASRIFGRTITKSESDKPFRDIGKKINHGRNYGMGARKQRDSLIEAGFDHYSEGDVKEFIAIWREMNRRTAAWQGETIAQAQRDGYLRNPFGRCRWFSSKAIATEALAFLPASTLADMVLRMMICHFPSDPRCQSAIESFGLSTYIDLTPEWVMAFQVHDSLVLQGPIEGWKEQATRSHLIMTQPWPQLEGFHFNSTVEFSEKNWGDCRKVALN